MLTESSLASFGDETSPDLSLDRDHLFPRPMRKSTLHQIQAEVVAGLAPGQVTRAHGGTLFVGQLGQPIFVQLDLGSWRGDLRSHWYAKSLLFEAAEHEWLAAGGGDFGSLDGSVSDLGQALLSKFLPFCEAARYVDDSMLVNRLQLTQSLYSFGHDLALQMIMGSSDEVERLWKYVRETREYQRQSGPRRGHVSGPDFVFLDALKALFQLNPKAARERILGNSRLFQQAVFGGDTVFEGVGS